MSIKNMHYDFKKKINKIDSQQYKNLLIPEIDWTLNEAQNIFVDIIAQPRVPFLGFEKTQKNTDDIKTLVIPDHCLSVPSNPLDKFTNTVPLPDDYRYYIRGYVSMTKGKCKDVKAKLYIQQHDDEFEESPFNRSNFEWRSVNGVFVTGGLQLYNDGTFTNTKTCLTYIRNPLRMHNAEDFRGGSYKLPSGEVLTGHIDCELPKHTHSEIVDLAVLIATGEMQIPDYETKLAKLNSNHLKPQ